MNYFLDSNTITYALKGKFPKIEEYMSDMPAKNIKVPAIVKAELLFGAEKSNHKTKVLDALNLFLEPFEIVAFDQETCDFYAKIRANLESKGMLIGPNDLVIASSVMAHHGCLITNNTKEFSRVEGLMIKDWTS